MRLADVIKNHDQLNVAETRNSQDDYWEIVLYNQDLPGWTAHLAESLGTAAKPAGQKPSRHDLRITEPWGQIRADQTLFIKNFEKNSVIAMFWPWQDNNHTTLKITLAQAENAPAAGKKKSIWSRLTGA